MAKHAKYVELVLKEEGMPSHFLSGYEVVSDYRSDGKRKLFLRKPEQVVEVPAKPKPKRKAKANANSKSPAQASHDLEIARQDYEASVARG